jgi:zinc transport system substrate-binding protein
LRTVLILTAVLLAAGCGGGGGAAGDGGRDRTSVVAGFYPLALAAERVGGDAVEVTNLTPPGAEPHDVELSARNAERVRDADVVLLLGEGFQPAVERAAAGSRGRAIDLLVGMRLLPGDEGRDPHVWLDPVRYSELVERVGLELGRHEETAAFAREVLDLHSDFEEGLADCERRELVVAHAAFGYLAERYGLEQIAIGGVSPEAEPSARDLERVAGRVRATGATTIFVEPLLSPRVAETVARETGATVATLDPLEGLSQQRLDAGADYLSVMRENLAALRRGLECR